MFSITINPEKALSYNIFLTKAVTITFNKEPSNFGDNENFYGIINAVAEYQKAKESYDIGKLKKNVDVCVIRNIGATLINAIANLQKVCELTAVTTDAV